MLLLGLDLGTTNAKVAAYDLAGGLAAAASVGYPTLFPHPGWAEQRPHDWTRALMTATRQMVGKLGGRASEIVGVALASQGPGLVLVDGNGAVLNDTSTTWQDERSSLQGRWLYERVGAAWPGMGGPFTNFLARLCWAIETYPEAAARAAYALGIKDYIVYWLTGEFATEPTSGSGGPHWPADVCAVLGWGSERLPRVASPTEVVGRLRPAIAREMGLSGPLPLVIGVNDGAAATLATGAMSIGDATITLSTSGVFRLVMADAVSAELRLEHNLFNWPYLPPDLWIAGGSTKTGAQSLQWLAEVLGGPEPVPVAELLAEASLVESGSSGVTFLPYLLGRGSPHRDADRTAAFVGMRLSTSRGALTRAVLEGAAFALRDIRDDLARVGYAPRPVRLSGGGGQSPLWRQILADVLEQPLTYFISDSTLGSAMIAAVGLGLHTDLNSAAAAMSKVSARHEPNADSSSSYAEAYAAFRRARDAL